MYLLIIKAMLTGALAVGISEISKRSTFTASVLASLPLTSVLALIWLYIDTQNIQAVRNLSAGIFWMVLPSLFFFIALPVFLKLGMRFYLAIFLSCMAMACFYGLYARVLKWLGVQV